MKLEIRNFLGEKIQLEPRLGLYRVSDMMGKRLPGLAVFLDELTLAGREPYCALTVSFGEFLGIKNSAYIDTNNCDFAGQLLKPGIAEATGLYKTSGFCRYPLWIFSEAFLKEVDEETYRKYAKEYDGYMSRMNPEPEETEDCAGEEEQQEQTTAANELGGIKG
jgi:hypothetical protein